MNKPIIGIVSNKTSSKEKPFDDFTKFINNYPRRIIEEGAVPIGLLAPDGNIDEEILNICDGFLFTGGSLIESWQLNVMHYAIENKKPVLGICLGMQTMAGYAYLKNKLGKLSYDIINDNYTSKDEKSFLKKCESHDNLNPFYIKDIEKSKHKIMLKENSLIYSIFKQKNIIEPSLHNYSVIPNVIQNSEIFEIKGMSDDGIIEVLEYKDNSNFVLGVQFHPELENINKKLFEMFINSAKNKK